MKVRPDLRVARSATSLQTVEFQPFIEWLKEMKEDAVQSMSLHSDHLVYRAQGRYEAIKEILSLVDQAASLADKLSRP